MWSPSDSTVFMGGDVNTYPSSEPFFPGERNSASYTFAHVL